MTTSNGNAPRLTPEQTAVVEAPADRPLLVLAGPGGGKTFTLIHRLGLLVGEGRRPLVLSFTRAVVREIHERLVASGTEAAWAVRPVTFDSLATRMLAGVPDLEGFDRWEQRSYDGRIDAAVRALKERSVARSWITDRFDYLVVDEVQDLVGRRARLVLRLADVLPTFTLAGDPAQGIYGWQDEEDTLTADAFLAAVRGRHGRKLSELHLTVNHRARTADIARLAEHRPALIDVRRASEKRDVLRRRLKAAEPLGSIRHAAHLLSLFNGRTAVLCRTNVEALMVSETLFEAGIDHSLRRGATERAVPPWLAEAVRGRRGSLTRSRFMASYETSPLRDSREAADLWDLLAQVGDDDERIELDRLADVVAAGRLPDALQAPRDARIVVSTIHRAKGLEFENVAVVMPGNWRKDADPAEDARVLFVAMTRPRDLLAHIRELDTFGWRLDPRAERWVRVGRSSARQTWGFEVRGDDAHRLHPAGTFLYDADATTEQAKLRDHVRRGDKVRLELLHQDDGDDPRAHYAIHTLRGRIGVTSDDFGRCLARRLGAKRHEANRWPKRISGLRIEGLDTVAGLRHVGDDAGLGGGGLWLRPRVVGLGVVEWKG